MPFLCLVNVRNVTSEYNKRKLEEEMTKTVQVEQTEQTGNKRMSKAAREIKVITPLVLEIQAGNTDKWTDLYIELAEHKKQMVNKYTAKLKHYSTRSDVDAKFDDLVMEAVERFDSSKMDNFVRYLYGMITGRMNNLYQEAVAQKRLANHVACSGDTEAYTNESNNSNGTATLFDTIENPINKYDEIDTAVSLLSVLSEYSEQSEKTKLNTDLIIASSMAEEGTPERKEMIMKLLPEGTTWAAARQKLSRAKADLKGYIVAERVLND